MKLTATHAAQYAGLAIGSRPRGMSMHELINLAGTHFAGMHPWRFYEGASVLLNLRGEVSVTNATWDQSELEIVLADAFASYDFLLGDTFTVISGTGLSLGTYPVTGKVDDDTITINTDIGGDTGTLRGTLNILEPQYVAVPSTIEEIVAIDAVSNNYRRAARYATKQEIASSKTQAWGGTPTGTYWLTDVWIGTPAVRWLEVYPTPLAAADDHFRLYGRGTWVDLQNDDDLIGVPRYAQPLLLEVVRAFARAYMQPETNPLEDELERVAQGRVFEAAVRADSTFTPSLGVLGPGAASQGGGAIDLITSPIGGPVAP